MFITDEMTPGEMLAELLRGRRVRPEATARFAALKHNRDLCPRFAERLNAMLDVYRAYNQEVHDIQGFHDNGVDVFLKYENRDGEQRRVGIQIKSEQEFRDWEAKKLEMISKLKAQHDDAVHDAKIDEYYIVLCVDAVRHQDRIRTVTSKLMNRGCIVIEPIDVLDFVESEPYAVTSRVTRLLCKDDRVLNGAIDALDAEDPDTAFFIVAIMCRAFNGDLYVDNETLHGLWWEWEHFARAGAGSSERLGLIVSSLTNQGVLMDQHGMGWAVSLDQLPTALCALYFEQKFRIADALADLRGYLIDLVDLRSRLRDADEDPVDDEEFDADEDA